MGKNFTTTKSSVHWILIIRILVGVLFIFSGLIKANDPDGLTYKMQEFFELWSIHGLNDYAKTFAIAIITFEILAGVCILIGFAYNTMAFLILILMLFFTFLTGYAVWYESSTGNKLACGCFGDCIPLTATQSFWKDIILLVLVSLLLLYRKQIKPLFAKFRSLIILSVLTLVTLFVQWYAITYLPFIDCLPYKVGADIVKDSKPPVDGVPDEYETTHIYKNLKTNEKVKFHEAAFLEQRIWEDTLTWEYDTTYAILLKEGNMTPKILGFNLVYFDGEETTDFILSQDKPVFLWFVRDVHTASLENIDHIKQLVKLCDAHEMYFYMVTSNNQAETDSFLLQHQLEVYTVTLDPTTSKTAVRTNPGLMLLEKGVIKGKWSYKNYPKGFSFSGDALNLQF